MARNTVQTLTTNEISRGMVVQFADRQRRRYVVCSRDCTGQFYLVALSGSFRGCAPSGVPAGQLVAAKDQTVEFTGAKASYLRDRCAAGMAHKWFDVR